MATYRVFLTRHYIAVQWADVNANSPDAAKRLAERVVYRLQPDPRQTATDNGWHVDGDVVAVEQPGVFSGGVHDMREISTGIFVPTEDVEDSLHGLQHRSR
jgi:hypothetical protein